MSGHEYHDFKIKWGMVIDVDKCTGCSACMVACQAENNVAIGVRNGIGQTNYDASNKLRTTTWMHVYQLTNKKLFPEADVAYLPRPCMQCGKPACVSVCPATATTKNEEGGIVSQIYPRCFGCRYCMAACPYHARYFNWFDPVWPDGMEKTLTPDVSIRPRGVVEKCTFCHHRWMKAKDKARLEDRNPNALADGEYTTSCTEACPNDAIIFGDILNPTHKVSKFINSKCTFRLLERLKTDPQVYYISRRSWVRQQGDNYLDT
ncbi:Menaquinone reductase, iron-sulfur cluster-binding subunit [Desulfovibrionales bacterium]